MDESQANVAFTLAKEFSTSALTTTMDMAGKVKDYIQRGPEGVGYLCFVGGAASVFLGLLGFLDIAGILMSPLQYLVNAYQTGFGLVVCVLEAPPEWLSNARLAKAQRFIHEFAKFLTTFGGRGLFYLFQVPGSSNMHLLLVARMLPVVMPGALSSFLFLVAMPFAPSSKDATSSNALVASSDAL
ncbi:unnamed protein product [Durusdinium trenchii]|uniref:ADP,ATP carrier protein n=1 Tax=Durusdinium trenchii TaxID=1381693 RepID=A0ABP0RXV7_9DINO